MAYEAQKCPGCGNHDTLVALDSDLRNVAWAEHGGRKIEVRQMRCIACASADVIKRDWAEKHKDDKPTTGHVSPADGRMFAAKPAIDEEG